MVGMITTRSTVERCRHQTMILRPHARSRRQVCHPERERGVWWRGGESNAPVFAPPARPDSSLPFGMTDLFRVSLRGQETLCGHAAMRLCTSYQRLPRELHEHLLLQKRERNDQPLP